ncbi:MAG TPA: type II CAAX endopeptidase family protein [Victivallales bacterium]|nr:type II CAAX endopeptidase family protein [Victivallales bacterium]
MKRKIVSIVLILIFLTITTIVMLKSYSLLGFHTYAREISNPFLQMLSYSGIQFVILLEMIIIVYIFAKISDKESLADIGIKFNKNGLKLFIIGMILAVIAALITWLTFLFIHHPQYSIVHKNYLTFIILIVLAFPASLFQGTMEEIVLRTWILKKLGKISNPITAIIIMGIIFGLLHLLFNTEYTIFSSFNAAIVGWVASYAYFKSKSVWAPAGIHVGWNYFLGVVYGMDFFHVTLNGHRISQFSGAEATVMGCITLLAIGVALYFILKDKKIEMW